MENSCCLLQRPPAILVVAVADNTSNSIDLTDCHIEVDLLLPAAGCWLLLLLLSCVHM